ncbi:MAG: OsmC family protein [Candidatus Cloacimonetes bacterium]|nr:OsmC family protein [Candidatus Cloacimonadota bacterium]
MAVSVKTKWLGNMSFESGIDGHFIKLDLSREAGGDDTGPRPKPLLLSAIHGCSGLDIVSILKKMRVKAYNFEMDAQAESTQEHPQIYHTISVTYRFTGENLPEDKILKAVSLSVEKYCGVMAMLSAKARIKVLILVNGKEVKQ